MLEEFFVARNLPAFTERSKLTDMANFSELRIPKLVPREVHTCTQCPSPLRFNFAVIRRSSY